MRFYTVRLFSPESDTNESTDKLYTPPLTGEVFAPQDTPQIALPQAISAPEEAEITLSRHETLKLIAKLDLHIFLVCVLMFL